MKTILFRGFHICRRPDYMTIPIGVHPTTAGYEMIACEPVKFLDLYEKRYPIGFGYRFTLQRKILFIILFEIRRFRLDWDSLAGSISELTALKVHGYHASFGAEHLVFVQSGAECAVLTGSGDPLTEEHGAWLLVL